MLTSSKHGQLFEQIINCARGKPKGYGTLQIELEALYGNGFATLAEGYIFLNNVVSLH